MANQKSTPKQIIENRVVGVVKSFESLKVSLTNNREKLVEADFDKIVIYLKEQVDVQTESLKKIYKARETSFKL